MAKKKLDELFQEKFQDFHEAPDEKVWQSLEAALDKKEKSRKVIPFWWKLGGVAAVLLAGLWLINPFSTASDNTENPIITTVEQDTNKVDSKQELNTPLQEQKDDKTNGIADTNEEVPNNQDALDPVAPKNEAYTTNANEDLVQGSKKEKKKSDSFKALSPKLASDKTQMTNRDDDGAREKEGKPQLLKDLEIAPQKTETAITDATNAKKQDSLRPLKNATEEVEEGIAQNTIDTNKKEANAKEANKIVEGSSKEVVTEAIAANDTLQESKKKSIFDEIKEQEEEELVAENTASRWSAGASVAPVFYSSFGEGSPVHSIFVENSKSGETNLSYGLSVAYELNSRLSVRSGIHKVDYGYGTDDIAFSSSLQGSESGQIDNIDYALNSRSLVVQSKAGPRAQSVNNDFVQPLDVNAPQATRDGTMSQQFEYLEIPLELNYALIDRKFGVNLIGGVSSLFLIDNSVSLTSGNQTLEMGEANNINSVNFSTNVGLGFDYDFSPKVKLNIEPVFKYQLNTFSDVDGTFQPFSVGIYSGLSFRF